MSIFSISPIDGRYGTSSQVLSPYFSESALIQYRVKIECEYFIALSFHSDFDFNLSSQEINFVRSLYLDFNEIDANRVKQIEQTTNHDVKAVEYLIKEKIDASELVNLQNHKEFIHFSLTSEDVNNLSFSLMYKDAISQVVLPQLQSLVGVMRDLAVSNAGVPFLSLTHGQTATPTTFGKEITVFVYRLERQIKLIENISFWGKFGGATGTWSAHLVAYPNTDWLDFAKGFVESFGLEFCPLTTQVVPADTLVESYDGFMRINTILIDFARDMWLYVMRGVLGQQKKEGEIGSSAMPHKINPINFENAEGNLQFANSLFAELGRQLPVSRMQRDVSGSTVIRNQGMPIAHSFLAYQNLIKAVGRVAVNKIAMSDELENHWEVLAEGIQNLLRKLNYPNPYEALKSLTRGSKITKEIILEFVNSLDIPTEEKTRLLALTPQNYIGLSEKLVESIK